MSGERVRMERKGPVAFITMDRQAKLNAIDDAMISGLHDALDKAEADDKVRVIVLSGAGRAFSAGFDLEETFATDDRNIDPIRAEIQRDFDLIMRFWDAEKPVIAAVHGACLGGAFEIALACDLVISSDTCRLGEPEVKFGSGVVAMLLPWLCGPKVASEIILLGEDRLPPETALRFGIVNRVVSAEQLMNTTVEMAIRLARNDPNAVRHARQAIKQGYDTAGLRESLANGMQLCIDVDKNPSTEAEAFHRKVKAEGTAAAAAWLDEQLHLQELNTTDQIGTKK